MIRRPLFMGTLAFCGAILTSYFLGRMIALIVLVGLAVVWRQCKGKGIAGAGEAALEHDKICGANLRMHAASILLFFYAVSFINLQLYDMQNDPFDKSQGSNRSQQATENAPEDKNETITAGVSGRVLNSSIRTAGSGDEYLQITLRVEQIDEQEVHRRWYERPVKLLVKQYQHGKSSYKGSDPSSETSGQSSALSPISPGTELSITGKVEHPNKRRNPNCFDYALYLKSIGIDRIMTADAVEIKEESKSLQGWLFMAKEKYLQQLREDAGEAAGGLMRGILFGEKTEIDEETLEEFQRNGTAHILAVSGLHIGILYGVLAKLWRGKKGWLYFWVVTLILLGYSFLASFSPSVVRASVMIVLHLYAKVKHRRYDLASASFVVLLLILLKNPMQLFHTGLQMSFLAVLTLSAATPFFKRFYQGIFLSSGVVQLGLLPYTAYIFNYLSLASVFVNVPIIILAGFIVPLGIAGLVLSLLAYCDISALSDVIIPGLSSLISKALNYLCEVMTTCNSVTCIEGITSFEVRSPPRSLMAIYYLLLLLFLSEEGRLLILRKRKKLLAVLIMLSLGVSWMFGMVTRTGFENAQIVFVDVGQGDCMHIRTEDDKNYLIDGGGKIDYNLGKKTLKPYLLKNGVKYVDGAFVTHLHTDHYKGITELCQEGLVQKLYLYEGNSDRSEQICEETGMDPADLVFLHAGQSVPFGESDRAKDEADASDFAGDGVEVLWPESDKCAGTVHRANGSVNESTYEEEDENETSLIMKIHVGGMSLLATGDIDAACEDGLAAKHRNNLKTDILKVAHHGSRYSWSDAFTKYTEPQAAVFQVGKNNYGHPNADIVAGYEKAGAKIYRNDQQGAIGFSYRGGAWEDGKKPLEVVTMLP